MNKKIIIALIALVVVLALMVGIYFITRPDTADQGDQTTQTTSAQNETTDGETQQTEKQGKTFTLVVVHGDKEEKAFVITSQKPYLSGALIDEGIITDEGLETGMYFTVDGETADWGKNQSYWAVFVDGEYANYGMNDLPIEEGTVYKLEYTIG